MITLDLKVLLQEFTHKNVYLLNFSILNVKYQYVVFLNCNLAKLDYIYLMVQR